MTNSDRYLSPIQMLVVSEKFSMKYSNLYVSLISEEDKLMLYKKKVDELRSRDEYSTAQAIEKWLAVYRLRNMSTDSSVATFGERIIDRYIARSSQQTYIKDKRLS